MGCQIAWTSLSNVQSGNRLQSSFLHSISQITWRQAGQGRAVRAIKTWLVLTSSLRKQRKQNLAEEDLQTKQRYLTSNIMMMLSLEF